MRVLNIEDDTFKHKRYMQRPCQDVGLKMSNGPIISRMGGNGLKTQWIVIIRMI